jgi:peptidyl-prolyl cis-trans isomerase C
MKKILVAVLTLTTASCLLASSKTKEKKPITVATVDGRPIVAASLDSTIKQMEKNSNSYLMGENENEDSLKQAALDSLINHKLIEIRGDSIKEVLKTDWSFNQNLLDNINQTIMKVLFDKQVAGRVTVDSAQVEQYYKDHQEDYMEPEQVKASHILVRRPKPDTAGVTNKAKIMKLEEESDQFAKDRAEGVLKKALSGENWDTLAATYSEDNNNSKKGGELGYFAHGRMMPAFDSVAFASQIGAIVGPVSTKYGYHIIRIEDHMQPAPRAFDSDLWNQIYSDLLNQEQQKQAKAYLDSLQGKASYVYNEGMLAQNDSLLDDKTWIMITNGTDTLFEKTVKESLPKYMRWKKIDTVSVADKKEMLGMLAPTYVLRSAAKQLGYMQDPEIIRSANELTTGEANLRLSRMLRNLGYDPTEEELKAYYDSHIDDYVEKRPLLVHHILFQDSLKAEAVRDSILAGAKFEDMAKRYYPGDPEIRDVLYNLDYIGEKEMGPDFFHVADSMQIGEISHPFKTGWGYHIIKLVNRREDRTFDQVRPGIKQHLKEIKDAEKTAGLVAEWRKMAAIQLDEKALKKYHPEDRKVIRVETKGQKGS